ncbi:reverse transcriptase-like protein [Citricoccus sp.]|uniref:reverse transcriptase-like protein n=1 Tax=Citricoccus sp. TaxID=1978372 RepID=UPI002C92F638|nr:reverse transcriptase-like protein [Citricoccus sp.]HRO93688.1 reverse transcriptase-like protein [Citricoccus sp.]
MPVSERVLQVEADGGSRGNPGVAGYGALVRDPATGKILDIDAAPLGRASNNVAEYSGLVAGLTMARNLDPEARVHVKMDSKLVVEQMSGRWKIKHADMQKLAGQARAILPPGRVTYEWIPREKNKDADLLSNEAMDAGASGRPWVRAKSGIRVAGTAAAGSTATRTATSAPEPAQAPGRQPVQEKPAPEPVPAATGAAAADSAGRPADAGTPRRAGRLHHVEIWVQDLARARQTLGWLFQQLGYQVSGEWSEGTSYQGAGEYLVLESGPDVGPGGHDRLRPGLNHLAFQAGTRAEVDALVEGAVHRGFTVLFAEKHPFAGGRSHYAAYLEAPGGFEVELVAEAGTA